MGVLNAAQPYEQSGEDTGPHCPALNLSAESDSVNI